MSNGDKKPTSAGRKGRRRNAARPPTIDGKAEEIEASAATETDPGKTASEEAGDTATQATDETTAKDAETAATDTAAPTDRPEEAPEQAGDAQSTTAGADADQTDPKDGDGEGDKPAEDTAAAEDGGTGPSDDGPSDDGPSGTGADTGKPAEAPLPTARRASLIGSALVGALIALIVYLGLYYGGVLPRDGNTELNDLAAQVEDLTRRASTMESTLARETRRNFAKDIAELESALQELGADPKNALVKRVRGLEEQIAQAAGAVTGGDGSSLLDEMQSKLAALETTVSQTGESAMGAVDDRLSAFETRLAQIESGIAERLTARESSDDASSDASDDTSASASAQTPSAGTDDTQTQASDAIDTENGTAASDTINPQTESAIGGRAVATTAVAREVTNLSQEALTALESRIDGLDKLIEEMSQKLGGLATTDTTATQDQVSKLETDLQTIRGELDTLDGKVSESTSGIDGKLAAFAKSIEERDTSDTRAAARTTAKALALTSLEKAVDRGVPFERELSVLKPLVDDPADLAVLEAHAATGVPDIAQLQSGFSAIANTILSAGQTTDGGILDTLASSARSLVQVRPIGQVSGDGPGAIVARIEAALRAGDLASAETEWGSLDAAGKASSADWARGLKARIAVNQAIVGLNAALTASLTGTAAPAGGDTSQSDTSGSEASTTAASGSAEQATAGPAPAGSASSETDASETSASDDSSGDASASDASTSDANASDTGTSDAGASDTGASDTGASAPDASSGQD